MVQIIFYRVGQLNDRYFDVLDNDTNFWKPKKTPLEEYLSLFEGPSFTLDNYYLTDGGTLNVSLDNFGMNDNIYTYNYMKMIDVDRPSNIRYYFIDEINLANGMAIIKYKVDNWHTYSGKMEIHAGVFDRALLGITGRKALPVAYTTNQPLVFSQTAPKKVYLVAEMNEYIITKEPTDATLKHNFTGLLAQKPAHTDIPKAEDSVPLPYFPTNLTTTFTIEEAQEAINELVGYQGVISKGGKYSEFDQSGAVAGKEYRQLDEIVLRSKHFTDGDAFDRSKIGYDITQIYAIPIDAINATELFDFEHSIAFGMSICRNIKVGSGGQASSYTMKDYGFIAVNSNTNILSEVSISIADNPKTVGFGTVSSFIPIEYDGFDKYYEITATATDYGFSIGLKLPNGTFTDIGSQFDIPLPYTTMNGAERQQQAMAKQMAKMQKGIAIAGMVATGLGIATNIGGQISDALFPIVKDQGLQGVTPRRFLAEFMPQTNYLSDIVTQNKGAVLSGVAGGLTYAHAQNAVNSPVSIPQSSNMTPIALVNAAYGFGTYRMIPNNNSEVDDVIKKDGYVCYLITNSIHKGMQGLDLKKAGYDVIRMANGYVSGPFSQSVARELESILRKGFRINYL